MSVRVTRRLRRQYVSRGRGWLAKWRERFVNRKFPIGDPHLPRGLRNIGRGQMENVSGLELTLAERVASVRWYHSLALPDNVITPGSFDTPRELRRLPFPSSLAGKRCLDVGTSDGFWAFERERRGAAEVIATDVPPSRLDWPGNTPSLPEHRGQASEE